MKALNVDIGEVKNNCTVIDIDKSKKDTKVKLRCNVCGREFNMVRYKFVAGRFRCSHGRRAMSPSDYIGETFGNVEIIEYLGKLGETDNLRPLVKVRCTNCGEEGITYLHRVQGFDYTCNCQKKDYEKLFYANYSYLIGRSKDTDTVTGLEYIEENDFNHRCLVKLRCNNCGTERNVPVRAFINNTRYKKCNCKPKTREVKDPIKRYNQLYLNKRFDKIVVIDIIPGNKLQNTLAICECDCGNIFTTMLSNIAAGDTHSCGCIKSFGERVVLRELCKQNVNFTYQQQMRDLFSESGRKLTFDFMILNNDNTGVAVIEVDGRQHREPVYFGSMCGYDENRLIKHYQSIVKNDKIKDDYVRSHGAHMYRINTDNKTTEAKIISELNKILSELTELGYNIFKLGGMNNGTF